MASPTLSAAQKEALNQILVRTLGLVDMRS
jgi:hypothetical protein